MNFNIPVGHFIFLPGLSTLCVGLGGGGLGVDNKMTVCISGLMLKSTSNQCLTFYLPSYILASLPLSLITDLEILCVASRVFF